MPGLLTRYSQWLHARWPAGTVERWPEVREDGGTSVPGVFVAGDLTGIPLLKFALDTGARAVQRISTDPALRQGGRGENEDLLDLVIIGAGVSGMAAAVEAKKRGLSFRVLESAEPFSTLVNFPKRKPIYTYPKSLKPAGDLQVTAVVKESLVLELHQQVEQAGIRAVAARAERVARERGALTVHLASGAPLRARRVLVAIGRSGNFRRLGVPGEGLDKVSNRLHDPGDYAGQRVLVVGGGDSAIEAAIALARAGAHVTISYRGRELSRPKHENLAALEELRRRPVSSVVLRLASGVSEIREREVVLEGQGGTSETLPNDAVFTMIGREAPLDFFRRSRIPIAGGMTPRRWISMGLFLLFCTWLYNWKSGGSMAAFFEARHWFPYNMPGLLAATGGAAAAAAADPRTLLGTLCISAAGPSFWYTLAYSLVVVAFGVRRIRRRRTPYVTAQTLTLMAVQVLPLFLLPEVILPQLSAHGLLPGGIADALFPRVSYGHGREFWRAYGLILAWPLNVYNIFTHQPLWWWIGIGFVQTCILIPLGIYFFGKGFYCGWICSCGALAETLGDTQRQKMPHGPAWNQFNLAGQGVLGVAVALLLVRIAGWVLPAGNWADRVFDPVLKTGYKWFVDVTLAGVVGYGVYFWYSGRFWCRFFCPLAALMHVYARFSRFAIVAEKKKCISCNVCTSVCHMGIDVMSFANKGLPMRDPECVRCSACVQSCPTGVLTFGQVDRAGTALRLDLLPASPVQLRERL
jgi:thioredoxin reductase/ferredoxin